MDLSITKAKPTGKYYTNLFSNFDQGTATPYEISSEMADYFKGKGVRISEVENAGSMVGGKQIGGQELANIFKQYESSMPSNYAKPDNAAIYNIPTFDKATYGQGFETPNQGGVITLPGGQQISKEQWQAGQGVPAKSVANPVPVGQPQYQILDVASMLKYKPDEYEKLPSGQVVLKAGVQPKTGTTKTYVPQGTSSEQGGTNLQPNKDIPGIVKPNQGDGSSTTTQQSTYEKTMLDYLNKIAKGQEDYMTALKGQQSSQDIYNQYRTQLGLPEKEKQIQDIETQLTNLEKNISDRLATQTEKGGNEIMTTAQKARIYTGESNPLIKNLSSLQQDIKPYYDQLAQQTKFTSEDQARQTELAKMPLEMQSQLLPIYQEMAKYKTPEQQLAEKITQEKALKEANVGTYYQEPAKQLSSTDLDLKMLNEGWNYVSTPSERDKLKAQGYQIQQIGGRTYAKTPQKISGTPGTTPTDDENFISAENIINQYPSASYEDLEYTIKKHVPNLTDSDVKIILKKFDKKASVDQKGIKNVSQYNEDEIKYYLSPYIDQATGEIDTSKMSAKLSYEEYNSILQRMKELNMFDEADQNTTSFFDKMKDFFTAPGKLYGELTK